MSALQLLAGGCALSLEITGAPLRALLGRPFAHLDTPLAGTAALQARVREGTPGEPAPAVDAWLRIGAPRPYNEGVIVGGPDDPVVGTWSARAAWLLDRERHTLEGWIADRRALWLFERGKPMLALLVPWLGDRGAVPVHAACVAIEGEAVLIGGSGGAGKTTTALACARAGWSYLGDDHVALTAAGEGFTAWSLYNSAFLDAGNQARFPWAAPHLSRDRGDTETKDMAYLVDVPGMAMATQATVGAIVLPDVRGAGPCELRRAPPGEALRRLVPSSAFQLPFAPRRKIVDRLAELVACVPAFALTIGARADDIPDVLREALA